MAVKNHYYLVDFENVGTDGIVGADGLGTGDYVFLFSTKNAAKISTATLERFNATQLKVREVPQGGQSVDMHLVSWLGFLIARNGTEASYAIVSRDGDYDNIIRFWQAETGVSIRRIEALGNSDRGSTAIKKGAGAADGATKKKAAAGKGDAAKVSPDKKAAVANPSKPKAPSTAASLDSIALNTAVLQALSKAKYDNALTGRIASLVVKSVRSNAGKQAIYRAIIAECGQKQGLDAYNRIKKLL